MHLFPPNIHADIPECFTDPFRYKPHPLVVQAAEMLIEKLEGCKEAFSEGKMLGVLIVQDCTGRIGYLAGFSGNVGGKSRINGFVPPIYDLLNPDGYFKKIEADISSLNWKLADLEQSAHIKRLKEEAEDLERQRDDELRTMKNRMALAKRQRDEIRKEEEDPNILDRLIKESQFAKAELKRVTSRWDKAIFDAKEKISAFNTEVSELKSRRATMSDKLQEWIFSQYVVINALGEEKTISEIFRSEGLRPPGGTGECAAPKLLNHAFRSGLKPIAMGEFWYGSSSGTAVRTHGHFYPSCTSKCGPLLSFMMKGLKVSSAHETIQGQPEVIFEDDTLIIISKPSGMPSVPGLDGRTSALEWLKEHSGQEVFPVHRLDMDTSGLIIFTKDERAASILRTQFEERRVSKVYKARLIDAPEGKQLQIGAKGMISIPLSADYDERPRQKADPSQGKDAVTLYEVMNINDDRTTDILFHPITGRTHQLRVHSAHMSGLGHPISGDMLYGGCTSESTRLFLHAFSITITHPVTGKELSVDSDVNIY